jgi:hypothetical protein
MRESQHDLVEPGRTPPARPIPFIVLLLAMLLYLPLHRGLFTGSDAVSALAMSRPIAAVLLLMWCIALAACGAWLIREARAAPDAFARPTGGV